MLQNLGFYFLVFGVWMLLPIYLAVRSKQLPTWVRLLYVVVVATPWLLLFLYGWASLCWLGAFCGGVLAFILGLRARRREMVHAGLWLAGLVLAQVVPIVWIMYYIQASGAFA